MRISIITDDTKVKLPVFNKWKLKFSKGIDIRKDTTIKSRLSEYNTKYPCDDIENESQFKKILHDFIRPANQMYGGMFTEVRYFGQKLSSLMPTQINFISGRYGLISENQEIIPYYYQIETTKHLEVADNKLQICEKINRILENNEIILFLLPKQYVEYFIKNGIFRKNLNKTHLIVVSSDEFREYFSQIPNVLFLRRIGVARIGEGNRKKILEYINKICYKS